MIKTEEQYIRNLIERKQSICNGCGKNLTNGMGKCINCSFDGGER